MVTEALHRRRFTLLFVVLVDLFPLVGVFAFEWDILPILVLYWVEACVYVARTGFEASFAARPVDDEFYGIQVPLERLREKRGSVRVVDWLPPVYPRNVPFALNSLWVLAFIGAVAALVLVFVQPPGTLARPTLIELGAASLLVVARHVATLVEFIREKRYEDHTALSTTARRRWMAVTILAFLLPLAGAGGRSARVGLTATLAVIVTGKLLADLVDVLGLDSSILTVDPEDHVGDETTIDIPETEPRAVIETNPRGVVIDALLLGTMLAFLPPTVFLVVFGAVAVGLGFGLTAGILTLVSLVAFRAVIEIGIARIQYGHLEYRVYEDDVVAYDTLLDAPQWRIARSEITDVRTRTAFTSKLLPGTFGKVSIERRGDSSRSLSHVYDPDELVRYLSR